MKAAPWQVFRRFAASTSLQSHALPIEFPPAAAHSCRTLNLEGCAGTVHNSFHTSVSSFHQSPQLPEQPHPPAYSPAGRVTGPYTVPRQPVFAVVELGPTQYKVSPDDLVYTEKLKGVDVNEKVSLNRVLLLGNQTQTIIGRPFVPQASVVACIEEQFQDAKVLIFKKRRRKNSRRLNGHRQELTCIRILEIYGVDADESSLDHAAAV
ncbi:hypothetical protein WJX74_007501 [Apatococcus lobatus]|uniref:Large ribosomal subunit protein bL21m n=1 Tax=Apatococcus lobatus TaxID=904363 RepID=A0AAW1SFH2_9CHLO